MSSIVTSIVTTLGGGSATSSSQWQVKMGLLLSRVGKDWVILVSLADAPCDLPLATFDLVSCSHTSSWLFYRWYGSSGKWLKRTTHTNPDSSSNLFCCSHTLFCPFPAFPDPMLHTTGQHCWNAGWLSKLCWDSVTTGAVPEWAITLLWVLQSCHTAHVQHPAPCHWHHCATLMPLAPRSTGLDS